jgi:allantoinase
VGDSRVVVRSHRVALPGGLIPAAVHIADERIAAITPYAEIPPDAQLVDAGDHVLMPGLVDTHVHLNEPGRTEWEGFETGTRAAAAGGVTTLIDMPLNSVPATTTVAALDAKREAAARTCHVDVGFWGGVVPGNEADLAPLWNDRVCGFKAFLVPSGVSEFDHVGRADLERAMPILARLGAPLLVHAEVPGPIEQALAAAPPAGAAEWRAYATYLASRPPAAEDAAIAMLLELSRAHGTHVHIVHLSSVTSLEMLRAARRDGVAVSVETCPHYLVFAAEEIPDGATAFKCAPPIRSQPNREQLWDALAAGTIDLVATDHSPAPPSTKCPESGDFLRAWGGIASLQLGLAAVWTAAREHGRGVTDIARWMCQAPARLAGLAGRKGTLAPGCDADLVIWDPDAAWEVDATALYHRHPLTPYAGRRLYGMVLETWLRGRRVFGRDEGIIGPPQGRLLAR